jgi:hypothetical protein
MSKYAIESTTLTAIGDAIREKTGTEDLIPVPQLASKILEISGGGGGGDISVTNGVLKTGTAEQDLQAGNLATFREYDPSFVSYNASYSTYCPLNYWGSGSMPENTYQQPKLKYIVPIGQGHFLFNYQASGTGGWAVGYVGDDNKFHYTDNALLMSTQSDTVCSGVIGFTEEGYIVYGYCYASGNTQYWICKLNSEDHTITTLDTASLVYASSNCNSKFMFNTKLVKLPAKNKYLIVSLSAATSSYQYYTFMAFTLDPTTGAATKNGETYYRYSSSGAQHYLGDVEVVSNTEVRVVTNKGVVKATASSTAWSSVSCTNYAWPDASLDHFDLISLVKYDDERYLASDGNYLEMFKWSGSAYTEEAKVYINKATSAIGNTMARSALQSQIFLQEDKTIVFMNISACAVVSYDTSTATFTWHNIVTMPSTRGTLSASYVSFGGRIDENTFYQVRTANDGYMWPILCRVGQDNSISTFDLTASKIKDVTPPSSYQISGYMSYALSAYCNKVSNCYQDGVLFITMSSTSSTTSSSSSINGVIFKLDKDVIKKGATGWGTPCLVKDNISAGSTGQAYVIE